VSPRLPRWVVRPVSRVYGAAAGEGILGDLSERYVEVRGSNGPFASRLWLALQIVSLLRAGVIHRYRTRRRGGGGGGRLLGDLLTDLRYALRMMRNAPGFAIAGVVTLSLGIGAATTFFSIADTVLWRPLPYPNAERMVSIGSSPSEEQWAGRVFSVSPALYRRWKESLTSYEALTGTISGENVDITGEGEPERYRGAWVDLDFARVFGIALQRGRWFAAGENQPGSPPVMLISDAMWRTRFGSDPNIVGRTISINETSRTIIGVLPPKLVLPEEIDLERIDVLMPMGQSGRDLTDTLNWYVRVVGVLRAGIDPVAAYQELETVTTGIMEQLGQPDSPFDEFVAGLESLKKLTLRSRGSSLIAMLGGSMLLVLIACSNVAHLLLARATARARDMSVRAAFGAGRGRLVRQQLTESLLLGLAGGAGGYLIAYFGIRLFRNINPGNVPRIDEIMVDWHVMWVALAAAVITGIGFGLLPALQATRRDIVAGLKAAGRGADGGGSGTAKIRNVLVAGQTGVAVIMVVGAALLINSFAHILNVDPGLDAQGVSDIRLTARSRYETASERRQLMEDVLQQVQAVPGVTRAAFTVGRPFGNPPVAGSFTIQGGPSSAETRSYLPWQPVSAGYLDILGARLVPGGRFIDNAEFETGALVAVVNRAFERDLLGGESALGRRVRLGDPVDDDPFYEVVGVIEDMSPGTLTRPASPTMYVPYSAEGLFLFSRFAVAVESDLAPAQLAPLLRAAVWNVDPDQVISSIATLEERIDQSLVTPIFYLVLFGSFGLIALALAAVGTYGTVSYGVARRKLEMGIRLALGAPGASVFKLVVRQGMLPVSVGLVVGIAGALALSRFVTSIVYGVSPTDAFTYVIVCGVLLTVALVACVVPARAASGADPMSALRAE
jgi:putative ABC transport system permease protein